MSELVIAILLGITISVTGCTKAGESSVSDYEQGGYFREEQQIEQKEEPTEEKQEDTNTVHKEKTSIQPADSNKSNSKVNNNNQNNNPVRSNKKVNNNSTKQTDNTVEEQSQQDELSCAICGGVVHNGEGIVIGNSILHTYCYQREQDLLKAQDNTDE